MDELLIQLKNRCKQLLAAVLFMTLLLGASAAALALLAAGISALSSPQTAAIASVATSAQVTNPPAEQPQPTIPNPTIQMNTTNLGTASGTSTTGTQSASATVNQTGSGTAHYTDFADELNNSVDHMHSPIGEAINNGGVVLGNQIQHTFGDFVAGVLKTLFLEQNDGSAASPNATSEGSVR